MKKSLFAIDWVLIPVFLLTVVSGIGMHVAGHGHHHGVWHAWAVFHVVSSLLFLIFTLFHVKMHWAWYKGVLKNGLGKKKRVTAMVSLLFVLLVLTGFPMLGVCGANSSLGLWHYRLGLVASLFFLGHILKRLPLLYKRKKEVGELGMWWLK